MSSPNINRKLVKINLALMIIILLWAPAHSQVVRTIKAQPGEICMLLELGAIIVQSDDGPKVEMILPPGQRSEKYKSVDLQSGDIIKMFNGKSMSTPALIEETYNGLAIGDDIMLGLKRGKEIFMQKFPKGDTKDMPARMEIKKCPASGSEASMDFIDIGILPEEKEGHIFISDVIPELVLAFGENPPAAGDEIVNIQSRKITSLKEMLDIYNKLKVGDTASLTVLRDKKELGLTFMRVKPEGAGPVKMIVK